MDSTMSEDVASSSGGSASWSEADPGSSSQNGSFHHVASTVKTAKKIKSKPLKEVLEKMLPQLQRKDLYQFFAFPVPAAEVPEYYTIIQRPMDFSTMEKKLERGEYQSVDSFRVSGRACSHTVPYADHCMKQNDFLLITENAQYFNSIDGPSGIIHTEAKKLQDWGLRLVAREGAAVAKVNNEDEKLTSQPKKKSAAAAKLNIRLKKTSSSHSSAISTPRISTPSRLNHEIKLEDEDDENDTEDDYDGASIMGSSGREQSDSIDGFGTPDYRDTPDTVRKYTRRIGPRAPYTHKKNRPRQSAVVALLSTTTTNEEEGEGRPRLAPVSSTSGAVAAAIPLLYSSDGSIDLERLTEDERRALLRPAGLGDWPNLLIPFIESILPLHTNIQPNAQSLLRPIKSTLDGFGSSLLADPSTFSSSFSYNVDNLPPEQEKTPFFITSGYEFGQEEKKIPLAWPRLTEESANDGPAPANESVKSTSANENTNASFRLLKGKDREKEREAAGVGNLDDWTFSRASQAKLLEHMDLGLYPGLLPAAWINHICSIKGGPSISRLPPFHLSTGLTLDKAICDDLTSLPRQVLLGDKAGAIDSDAPVAEPTSDVCATLEKGGEQNWQVSEEEKKKAGVCGTDVIREVVYGGAMGEAYTSSVFNFVSGAAQSALERQGELFEEDKVQAGPTFVAKAAEVNRVVPSYFDDDGEMLDKEGYIGMGLIPLEIRKEAGLSDHSKRVASYSPLLFDTLPVDHRKRASRDPSVVSAKRRRLASTPMMEEVKIEDDDEQQEDETLQDQVLDSLTFAYISGTILGTLLVDHVRDEIINPLTGGMLDILVQAGQSVQGVDEQDDQDGYDWDTLIHRLDPLFDEWKDLKKKSTIPCSSDKTVNDKLVGKLAKKLLKEDYKSAKWLWQELSRVRDDVIEFDGIVHTKDEMIAETQQTNESQPLRWTSMEMNSEKVSKALQQYASILETFSKTTRQGGATETLNTEQMNSLRLAYVALAKLVPTKELGRGQWAAWAEYIQQQMTHQKQWQLQDKEV